VDFKNVILIMTSNLGSQFLIDSELDANQKREAVLLAVRTSFKPEFLNRLDDVVIFDALSKEELGFIVDLNIDKLTQRLEERRLTLGVSPAARLWLAENGYDPVYGARPLRRLMQKEIDDRLANLLLAGEVSDGSFVRVDVAENQEALSVSTVSDER
jgi:ATP-dependent Clp protease ATP-binding subunit ClpB